LKSTVRRIALTGLLCGTGFVMLAQDADAATLPLATVSTNPANWTPQVVSADATVRQIVQCGSMMYAVGTFSQVAQPGGGKITRNNAFSFNATTGVISSWNPNATATVYGVALSSDCSSVYLAGSFSAVGGAYAEGGPRRVALLELTRLNCPGEAIDQLAQFGRLRGRQVAVGNGHDQGHHRPRRIVGRADRAEIERHRSVAAGWGQAFQA
jgi:hypothetical protein